MFIYDLCFELIAFLDFIIKASKYTFILKKSNEQPSKITDGSIQ